MIIGIGVDLVDVERFKWMMRRSPDVLTKVLHPGETHDSTGRPRTAESLAARFAAKEAVVKALGDHGTLRPADCEIVTMESGRPELRLTGELAEVSDRLGITDWHVSLAHDGGSAIAYVIAERRG